jgi:crotonobetainyl-CoA:carnitine CoA-transferase CaiB-like acyl-CoA transferase
MAGPLEKLKVVELTHEACAWAGKLLADLGAETIVVEPPGGSQQRSWGPWLDDQPGPERSLWWWYYNTNKKSVVLDIHDDRDGLIRLLADADILIEGEAPERLGDCGLDDDALTEINPALIHASITPYGRRGPSRNVPATDLTVLAEGGPVWSCGYDDHALPPVRGGGGQASHIASHWAVQAIMVALFDRLATSQGQHIDVSMVAAANVTTEVASYGWLAAGVEVQRQTGRHAWWTPSLPVQARCADGRYVNTGVPPRSPEELAIVLTWLDELGLRDEFPLSPVLQMGAERERLDLSQLDVDPMLGEILTAAREVSAFLCERLTADEFFQGWQSRGLTCGVVYSPDEAMADPHVVARGFPIEVHHPELDRAFTYPGAPYRFSATPWEIRQRAPLLGEHQDLVPPGWS